MTTGAERPFRFGVTMLSVGTGRRWRDRCRLAEALGYDVISLPDHLGMPSPLPAVVAAAAATDRVRVGTSVLNAGFWNPVLLARDVATADQLCDGCLELGLGTGYVAEEYDAVGAGQPSPGERVDRLDETVSTLRRLFADPARGPRPLQSPGPPLLLGARGDRTAMLAARLADIIGFTGVAPSAPGAAPVLDDADAVAERIDFTRTLLGDRRDRVELNFLLAQVVPSLGREDSPPALLTGTAARMADDLRERRRTLGLSYVTVLEPDMTAFAEVIALLR